MSPASLTVERLWEVGQSNDGQIGPGVFGIAPDASEVIVSGDEYAPTLRHFSASDGALTSRDPFPAIWRDPAWTIQGEGGSAITVRSLASGLPIFTLPGGDSAPSGDGQRVLAYSCQGSETTIQSLDVPSGSIEFSRVIEGGCASSNLVTTASGDVVLYSLRVAQSDDLYRVELATSAQTSIQTQPVPVSKPTGDGLSITLSHGERSVATVGRDAILRLWSYPALERIGGDIPTLWTTSYRNCYCSYRRFAPVAWSSDDALLALSDADGNTVIRRTCDGAIVTAVPSPTPTMRSHFDGPGIWGPTFLAFGPRDETLAVFYEGSLALYRLRRGP